MTVNAGVIVSVPGNELLQFGCRLGEVFNVEGHILNQTGCSRRTGSSYRGENARTDCPIFGIFLGTVGKVDRDVGFKCL